MVIIIDKTFILQIACNPVSVQEMFSEGSQYEHLFQLHPKPGDYATAVAAFVQHFGWRRMAILSQEGDFYSNVSQEVK